VERDIDRLQKLLEGGDEKQSNKDDVDMMELEKSRRLYELTKRDSGELSSQAISKGVEYADLLGTHSVVKASKLITKLLVVSRQTFGMDHWVTKKAKKKHEKITTKCVSILHEDHGMMKFKLLAYNKQEDCYLLSIPDEVDDEEGSENDRYKDMRGKTVYAPRRRVVLSEVVPVVILGLPPGPLDHLNGKIGETKMFSLSEDATDDPYCLAGYTIQFEDDNIEDCEVPPGCVLILCNQVERRGDGGEIE